MLILLVIIIHNIFLLYSPCFISMCLCKKYLCRILHFPYYLSGPIKFLIKLLVRALSTENHRHLGFSAAELAEGLTQIAVNDNNKKTVACLKNENE